VVNNFLYCPGGKVQLNATNHAYNTAWGSDLSATPASGTGDYFTTKFPAATKVFVDPSDATENFRLFNDTADASGASGCKAGKNCLKDGTTLPSPYNLDLLGAPRGTNGIWDRGAYQSSRIQLNITTVH
jgi:hypothetical protein